METKNKEFEQVFNGYYSQNLPKMKLTIHELNEKIEERLDYFESNKFFCKSALDCTSLNLIFSTPGTNF